MFGFLIGTVCLIALIVVLRRGPHHGFFRMHGAHGHRCHSGGWMRRRGWTWRLFERLETSPGQEREIRDAIAEVREAFRALAGEADQSRDDLSRAIRAESLDEVKLGEMFSRHDDRLRTVQRAFAGAMARIHAALDDVQRARLADLLESNPRWGFGGPYRTWGH